MDWIRFYYEIGVALIDMLYRFVQTGIMSDIVRQTLAEKLKSVGSAWTDAGDSAKAVLRVASDKSINGMFHSFL